ncbi:uncharacterized protein LOC141628394 [Silene latifolia]|uniref:uncharacterized protein LOC141628394 n=1 Tax=Silene latifolia TaxID=37657 RepID=UPI003D77DCCC
MVLRIHSWGAKQLSYAGRLTLVKAVLTQLHCYWARIYLLPKGIIQKVDSICRNYLWSGKEGYHRVPAVSWERCCQSKLYGGLGINNSHVWNIASIGKYSWWVSNKKDSLWVKWIHHLYVKQQDWWNYSPNINSSWVWRQICKVKDKLKTCLDYQTWLLSPYSTQKTYDCLMGTREKARWIPFVWNRESQQHLFFECHFSAQCLSLVRHWLGVTWSFQSLDCILRKRFQSLLQKQVLMASFACLVYLIWMSRNTAKHDSMIPRPARILLQLQSMIKFRVHALETQATMRNRDWLSDRGLLAS